MPDFHHFKERTERKIEKLKTDDSVFEGNRQPILDFVNDCYAERLSHGRIYKFVYFLITLSKLLGKDFRVATKEDLKELVRKIESSPKNYTENTKKDFRVVLKKFYKWLEGNGEEYPETVMYKISHILKKIFNLGVQQEGILQDAIQKSYRDKGIDIKSTEPKDPPTFEDVKNILEESTDNLREEKRSIQTIETLLVRLRPLFNTGFFSGKKSSIPFSQIFKKTTILRLKNMPTEEVKYAVAEFFINKLRYELYSRGKSDNIVLYCIVDEAHRLIDERPPLNDLLRESRKYGTGVILSSQRPSDFSDTVLANLGGILSFQCRLDRDAIFVARQMGMNFELIKGLTEIGTGYVNFSSEKANRKIKIVPLWERKPEIKKPKEKKEKAREEKKDIVVEKRPAKNIISESEKITLIEGRKTSPLLAWLFAGFRTCFSDPRISALVTVAAILILWSLSYVYWIAFFIALISILIIVGRYFRH